MQKRSLDPVGLHACCWTTIGMRTDAVAAVQEAARSAHPGAPVVVTCQRTEAYGFDGDCRCGALNRLEGVEAVTHLAEVAAGLHSVVLGEPQVLGQVRQAFATGETRIRRVANVALAAAREVRRETAFNSHAGELLDRALRVAGREPGGRLVVVGAGQLGRLVAERGRAIGFAEVLVASRSRPAATAGTQWIPLERLAESGPATVVVTCLGSGAPPIAAGDLPSALLAVDLGTPPNLVGDPGLPLVTLADLLGDEERRPHARRRRAALRALVRAKVEEQLREAESPAATLRAEVERVRQEEVARMRRLHPEVDAATVEALTRSLVNRLFHTASVRLRDGDGEFGRAVAALFTATG